MRCQASRRLLIAVLAAGMVGACDSEALLGAPEQVWLWFVVPLLGFLIGGTSLLAMVRGSQLRHWDLRTAQSDRGIRGVTIAVFVVAVLAAIAFLLYNLPLQIDPRQKALNAGLWFLGSVLGASIGTLVGYRLARLPAVPPPKGG